MVCAAQTIHLLSHMHPTPAPPPPPLKVSFSEKQYYYRLHWLQNCPNRACASFHKFENLKGQCNKLLVRKVGLLSLTLLLKNLSFLTNRRAFESLLTITAKSVDDSYFDAFRYISPWDNFWSLFENVSNYVLSDTISTKSLAKNKCRLIVDHFQTVDFLLFAVSSFVLWSEFRHGKIHMFYSL